VNPADPFWRDHALQTVGSDILLLSGSDALDGLRDQKLNLRPGRYSFAALDPDSGATYKWTSASGRVRLAKPAAASVKQLRLGFDFSAAQAGEKWSAQFQHS